MTVTSKKKFVFLHFKMAPLRDHRVKFLHLIVRDTKYVRSQTLSVCLAQQSTRSRRVFFDDESVNKRAGSGRNTVVDRDSLRDVIRKTASNGILQAVTTHNSLSTTACTSVDTFAIAHALPCRVNGCAKPTRLVL